MKNIVGCMAVFIAVIFIFSCSGGKSFEKSEDFESGKFTETLFTPGQVGTNGLIVSDPEKVVNGKFSAYGKGDPSKAEWWSFIYSDNKKIPLERKGSYKVSFTYKAVQTPSADGSYYFLARTTAGGYGNDTAFTKWSGATGEGGTKTIDITLGDFDDYYLIWGIHRQGALSIDDIKVTKRQ